MYIIPYCVLPDKNIKGCKSKTIMVFLSNGGKSLWKTDDNTCDMETIQKEYLEANGFFGTVTKKENYILCEVQNINFNEYYTWLETEEECWRPFFYIEEKAWKYTLESVKVGPLNGNELLNLFL
jgi:hypothetical protein